VLSNVLSRATFAPFHVESQIASQSGHFEVELHTTGVTDVVTQTVTFAPGGYSGWHSHPGLAILSVKSGTLTFYEAEDACGGRLRILATIRAPEITGQILDHLGIPSRPPPVAAAVFQQLPFAFE
jgi:hypothetical protein